MEVANCQKKKCSQKSEVTKEREKVQDDPSGLIKERQNQEGKMERARGQKQDETGKGRTKVMHIVGCKGGHAL